jgi:hypothetical protein
VALADDHDAVGACHPAEPGQLGREVGTFEQGGEQTRVHPAMVVERRVAGKSRAA